MASALKKLSFFEKLRVIRILMQTAIIIPVKIAGVLLFPNKEYKHLGTFRSVYPSVMRFISESVPQKTFSILATHIGTGKVLEGYCTKNKIPLSSEDLPHGARLHWIGERNGSKVLLFFHGGGYNVPPSDKGHIGLSMKMAAAGNTSIAFLEYTLAGIAPYPMQLRQATAALAHLLTTYAPSDIIIAGDSAGGHLATGLMSHLTHPSEKVDPLKLEGKIGGICLISPFSSFDYSKASYKENARHDFLTLENIKRLNSTFKPIQISDEEAMKDPCLSPADAPLGWWENVPVERVIILWGTWEVFADGCSTLGKRLESEAGKASDVRVVGCDREVHDGALMDTMYGLDERKMMKEISSWMKEFK